MKIKSPSIISVSKLHVPFNAIFNVSSGIIALLLGLTSLLGAPSPFAVAFVASLPTKIGAISFVCSSVGYVLGFGFQEALSYIFSMVLILISKNLFDFSKKFRLNRTYLPMLVGGCYIVMSVLIAIALTKSASEYFLIAFDSILCGGVCFCFSTVIRLILNDNKEDLLRLSEITAVVVLSMLGLICLAQVDIGMFNLGVIVALLLVVVATYCMGSVWGMVACVISGAAIALYDRSAITFFAIVGFCSLISGVFRFWGKIGQVASFIFLGLVSIMVIGVNISILQMMLCLLVALTLFLVIPHTILEKITLKSEFYVLAKNNMASKESSKIRFASNTLVNLKSSFEQAYEKLYHKKANTTDSVISACSNKICKKCPKSAHCWIDEYGTTMDYFNKMVLTASSGSKLESTNMPEYMQKNCIRTIAVANFISSQYEFKATKKLEIEQFQSCVDMLCGINDKSPKVVCDRVTAELVKDALVQFGLTPSDVIATVDLKGRTSVDVFFAGKVVCDTGKIAQALSVEIGKYMQAGDIAVIGSQSKLSFFDMPEYSFRSFVIQKAAKTGDKCGDSICAFTDGNAVRHVVLSDGMGTGGQAALDSAITVDFVKNLIISGFDYKSALEFVNSSLQLRAEESLATVDVLTVDLYSGSIAFKKAGSASSFIKCKNDCSVVKTQSLPIGIMGQVDFDEQEFKLEPGDMVVMVSDGVIENSSEWLAEYLQNLENSDVESVCKEIYRLAVSQSGDKHSDDMTIMVGMLAKN